MKLTEREWAEYRRLRAEDYTVTNAIAAARSSTALRFAALECAKEAARSMRAAR